MKHLAVFILVFLSSIGLEACADYPFGDDIRFCIFRPQQFGFSDLDPFYFSAHNFWSREVMCDTCNAPVKIATGERMNCELWRERCKNIPSVEDVHSAVYGEGNDVTNDFVKFLHAKHDSEAIAYLNFARQCSALADFLVDPWERNEKVELPQRRNQVRMAIDRARAASDAAIRKRYAFQAIRSSYYTGDPEIIRSVYNEFFCNIREKDIIDYWALYFIAICEPKGPLRNYYAAQVFKNAPDKRFMVSQVYDKSIPVSQTLQYAKNKSEESAVWFLSGIRNSGKALESLTQLAAVNPNDEGLIFLLLREVNKLEDWIYTPYYTNFRPVIEMQSDWSDGVSHFTMQNRIVKDRAYAQQVLNFVNTTLPGTKDNSLLWRTARAYLFFMTLDFHSALSQIESLQKQPIPSDALQGQIEMIKALCLTAQQPSGNAVIPEEAKAVLLKQDSLMNQKFILAMAKELEYKGNTTDAALLMSKLNRGPYPYWSCDGSVICWKNKEKHAFNFANYYVDYFAYIDGDYSTAQLKKLITAVENGHESADSFSRWKTDDIIADLPRLYDLLGTKFIRENKLDDALASFEKVNDTLWTSKYEPYATYLNANPFYTNMYNEHRKTDADTIRFDKESITRTLIAYLQMAEDSRNKDRDYYYFLVANCYFNMTNYGNSWMMRRYWTESSKAGSGLPDGREFFNCDFAKEYYLKALTVSKKKEFAALCLRMAGRCEKYHLVYSTSDPKEFYLPRDDNSKKHFDANIYYSRIKRQYPEYYDDLISNCYSFDDYFAARR